MNWVAVVWSGFVGIVVALAFYAAARSFRWTRFDPMSYLGSVFVANPRHPAASILGFILLLLVGSTVVAFVYAALFEVLPRPWWAAGLAVGLLHGLLTAAALPIFGTISASVRAGFISPPGRLGTEWGWLTPGVLAAGHGIYGAVCGAILANS